MGVILALGGDWVEDNFEEKYDLSLTRYGVVWCE